MARYRISISLSNSLSSPSDLFIRRIVRREAKEAVYETSFLFELEFEFELEKRF